MILPEKVYNVLKWLCLIFARPRYSYCYDFCPLSYRRSRDRLRYYIGYRYVYWRVNWRVYESV